jgi:hypothetical protein
MKMHKQLLIISIGIIISIAFSLVSCKKIEPTKAIITVTDSLNYKIKDVLVIVFAGDSIENPLFVDPFKNKVLDSAYTDASGKVEFEFTNASIFQIYAEKYINGSKYFTENVLVLEKEKTVEKSVVLEKEK